MAIAPSRVPKWVVGTLLAGGLVVIALLAVIVVLLAGGSGDDQKTATAVQSKGTASPSPSSSAGGETFTVIGTLTLIDSGNENLGGGGCEGGGGYSDMTEGAQVVVRDATGKTIAVDALQAGTRADSVTCEFGFEIFDVPPAGGGPYSVEVSHRGEISFTQAEATDVALTLGN